MKDTIEIRWHGRGGQGAKTAALLLADVAFKTGKYVQDFLSMVQREWVHLSLLTTGSAVNLSEYIPTFTSHSMWL